LVENRFKAELIRILFISRPYFGRIVQGYGNE
jgi:hypothetical protein